MQSADECLADAQLLLDNDRLRAAIGRAYYAMFNAARAALVAAGMKEPRSHKALLDLFGREFVRTGRVERQLFRDLLDAFDARVKSDYEPLSMFDPEHARRLVDRARSFVARVRALLGTD